MRSAAQVAIIMLSPVVALVACASGSEPIAREARPAAAVRTSASDPLVLSEWWTNGHALLRLRPEGGYEVYPGTNRYEPPRERGRWTKRSHVALEFDPYAAVNPRVERVQIDRDSEGGPVLILRSEWPFVPMSAPPEVLEDSLFGSWRGEEFSFTLSRNMRYTLRRHDGANDNAGAVSGHEGSWSIRGVDQIVLVPAAPGIEPIVLELEGGNEITIAGAERVDTIR